MGQALEMCKGCETPRDCDTCLDLHEWIMEHMEPRWISVEDRMPDEDHICLAIRDDGRYDFAMYRGHDVWNVNGVRATDITHWMPLPEPLEED